MQGRITKFRGDVGVGVIAAEDGRRYRFSAAEVRNPADEILGQDVDFLVAASRPVEIIMMCGSPWTAFGGLSLG